MATAETIAQRLNEILNVKGIDRLVAAYFAGGDSPFAGPTFDTLDPGPPHGFTVADIAAVSLLDVRFSPPAMRHLVVDHEVDAALSDIPTDVALWEADDDDINACFELVKQLKVLPNVGVTRATKLSARKRPLLCPIYDSVVERVMELGRGPWRVPLALALKDGDLRARLDALDPRVDRYSPSTLRLLDVAIWMVGSNATTAQDARGAVGLQRRPLW